MTEPLISPLRGIITLLRPLIVLDYETTGTDPAKARICSVGMRRHNVDGTLQIFKTLVNPRVPMPKEASDTHAITQYVIDNGCAFCWREASEHPWAKCEKFRTVPTFAALAPRLHPVMIDADFAGYNIRYDLRVAAAEFDRVQMEFDYSLCSVIDSLRLWQLLEPRTLSDAVEHFLGEVIQDAHDAMADVESTERVLIAQLTGDHPNGKVIYGKSIKELHEAQWPRNPNALDSEGKFIYDGTGHLTFTFGKHKGKPVATQMSYVRWMSGPDASFSPEVRKLCLAIIGGNVLLRRETSG